MTRRTLLPSTCFALVLLVTSAIPIATLGNASCSLCLVGPDNMAFDKAGDLYLVDTDHKKWSRVLKVSSAGRVLAYWRVFTNGSGRNGPEGIAVNSRGIVFVTDAGSSRVLKLSADGRVLGALGGPNTFHDHDLGHVAIDAWNNVFVAEAPQNLIQEFSASGNRIASHRRIVGSGTNQWGRGGPETIAVLRNGDLVVQDWSNFRVQIVSPDGNTVASFGSRGTAPGHFLVQSGIAVDDQDRIYVSELRPVRVQIFDSRGLLRETIRNNPAKPLFRDAPYAIAVDHDGNIYSPDGLTIVKYNRRGEVLARWK